MQPVTPLLPTGPRHGRAGVSMHLFCQHSSSFSTNTLVGGRRYPAEPWYTCTREAKCYCNPVQPLYLQPARATVVQGCLYTSSVNTHYRSQPTLSWAGVDTPQNLGTHVLVRPSVTVTLCNPSTYNRPATVAGVYTSSSTLISFSTPGRRRYRRTLVPTKQPPHTTPPPNAPRSCRGVYAPLLSTLIIVLNQHSRGRASIPRRTLGCLCTSSVNTHYRSQPTLSWAGVDTRRTNTVSCIPPTPPTQHTPTPPTPNHVPEAKCYCNPVNPSTYNRPRHGRAGCLSPLLSTLISFSTNTLVGGRRYPAEPWYTCTREAKCYCNPVQPLYLQPARATVVQGCLYTSSVNTHYRSQPTLSWAGVDTQQNLGTHVLVRPSVTVTLCNPSTYNRPAPRSCRGVYTPLLSTLIIVLNQHSRGRASIPRRTLVHMYS
ncbi:hypothetical protein J6590_002464 [Homalodisca vitripennis]|nr:hypothetical protein J6590_002464 [Homalodisca vitripennis]